MPVHIIGLMQIMRSQSHCLRIHLSKQPHSLSQSCLIQKRQPPKRIQLILSDLFVRDSVIDIANKEVAKVIDSAPETMDTLKKIADLIEKDAEQAADILATLGDHEARIDTLENRIVVMSETEYANLTKKEDKFYFCYEE